jgi:ubiquinone biosynthesis protein COQ9
MSSINEKDNASLERGAANDIVRLRWRIKIRENVVARLQAENERLRNGAATICETVQLTAEERAAIQWAMEDAYTEHYATLRNLLARLA